MRTDPMLVIARLINRLRPWFSRRKWPGWLLVLFYVYNNVPDQQGRIMFWLAAAKAMRGHLGLLAKFVESQFFNFGLLVLGVGYLLLAGEVKVPVRQRGLSTAAWILSALIGLAYFTVLVAGYVSLQTETPQAVNDQIQRQVEPLQREIGQLLPLVAEVHNLEAVSATAKAEADSAKPGSLKQRALELSSQLMNRVGGILNLAGRHVDRSNGGFGTLAQIRQFQEDAREVEAAHRQSATDAAQLMSDYTNIYANRILAIRQECIQKGQKDWKDEQFYSHPNNVEDIRQIAADLFVHANLLN